MSKFEKICKIWKKGLPARCTKLRRETKRTSGRLTHSSRPILGKGAMSQRRRRRRVTKKDPQTGRDDTSTDWMQGGFVYVIQTGFSLAGAHGGLPGSQFGIKRKVPAKHGGPAQATLRNRPWGRPYLTKNSRITDN